MPETEISNASPRESSFESLQMLRLQMLRSTAVFASNHANWEQSRSTLQPNNMRQLCIAPELETDYQSRDDTYPFPLSRADMKGRNSFFRSDLYRQEDRLGYSAIAAEHPLQSSWKWHRNIYSTCTAMISKVPLSWMPNIQARGQ